MLSKPLTGNLGTPFPVHLLPLSFQLAAQPLICPGERELTITLPGIDGQNMTVWTDGSEVARFRQLQQVEEEAARLGLSGPAIVGNHDAIIKRLDMGAAVLNDLFRQGRADEAYALWDEGILGEGSARQ